jgi:hypothetical protein
VYIFFETFSSMWRCAWIPILPPSRCISRSVGVCTIAGRLSPVATRPSTISCALAPRIGNVPETLALLQSFRHWLPFLPFTDQTAAVVHRLPMADFEDACQAATAWEGQCEVIATRNVSDF